MVTDDEACAVRLSMSALPTEWCGLPSHTPSTGQRSMRRVESACPKQVPTNHGLSYPAALERTECEGIETTVKKRRPGFAGNVFRMGDELLPKVMTSGELEGATTRDRGRPTKQWPKCVVDDVNDFGIPITM